MTRQQLICLSRLRNTGVSGMLAASVLVFIVCSVLGMKYPQPVAAVTSTPTARIPTGSSTVSLGPTVAPTSAPRPTSSNSRSSAEKDWWDKADVISQFFSGVVIAVVGLWLTYILSRTQTQVSKDTSTAQIKSAEIQAAMDRRLHEGQLTGELVEYLTSDSDEVREIAIIALRGSVPPDIYDPVIEVLARSDKSASVREAAIRQLGYSANDRVASTLGGIATDPNKPDVERNLASRSASQVALSTGLTPSTFVLTASGRFGYALELPELQGGVFTHYLIEGLQGRADLDHDGTVTARELANYVRDQVVISGNESPSHGQLPTYAINATGEIPIVGTRAPYTCVAGLVIGVDRSVDPALPESSFARQDAKRLYDTLMENPWDASRLHLLSGDCSRSSILRSLENAAATAPEDSLFVLYYSGMGILVSGRLNLMAGDSFSDRPNTLLPYSQIKSFLGRTKSAAKAVFLDTCYSGSACDLD